ncbi:MAG TPA: type II toxin-antitoxin system MqsA family antitoxin [Clostridia bacterium]|nr:type II toxin-antitoxin system MqsA family antitoxin [Clostridia bacterium]
MNCIVCKGELTKKDINQIVDIDGHIIIIKNVPAEVCEQCGESFFENQVALTLEKIVDEIVSNKAEITIVNYNDKVA